jgi:signal transduction histidine kinase/Tfp pilus assembly protein PilF
MKAVVLFTLCLFLCFPAIAQTDITLLTKEIAEAKNDSLKLEGYRKIYKLYEYTQTDSAIYYLNQGNELFRKRDYTRGRAYILSLQANVYEEMGMDDWAEKKYEESLELFALLKDNNGLAGANNGFGMLQGKMGNFDVATKYFYTALKLFESAGNTNAIVSSYINLGRVSAMAEHYDMALGYFSKALDLLKDQPVRPNTIHLYNNIGSTYARQDMFDSALYYFEKSLKICRQEGLTMLLSSILNNIGNIHRIAGETELALKNYNEALEITQKVGSPEEQIRLALSIATLTAKNQPQKSIATLTALLDSARKIKQKPLELDVLSTLIMVHKQEGNYKEAMDYVVRNTELEDSLFNIEKSEQMQGLRMAYETDKANEKIKQLEISEQASNRNKNISILITITLLILLLTITFFYRKAHLLNVELTKANNDKDRLFSIIGHDLRGPVSNIPIMIDLYKEEMISEAEKTFLLDALKKNAEATIETLEKLLSWGKTHIKDARLNQTVFDVSADVDNNIELLKSSADQKEVKLINNVAKGISIYAEEEHFRFVLRNLLSNALKFTPPSGTITINANKQSRAGYIIFSVKDTGVGISKARQKNIFSAFNESTPGTANEMGTGLGLMLCEKFVKENGGEIWVESEEGKGSIFYFTFVVG